MAVGITQRHGYNDNEPYSRVMQCYLSHSAKRKHGTQVRHNHAAWMAWVAWRNEWWKELEVWVAQSKMDTTYGAAQRGEGTTRHQELS